MAKSEKAASERRKCGAHERKDLRVRWTSRNVTAVGGFGERVNESCWYFPAFPLIEPKLTDILFMCTSKIYFYLKKKHILVSLGSILLFSFSILTCAYIVSGMLWWWWCILCLASIIPSECCMVCVLFFFPCNLTCKCELWYGWHLQWTLRGENMSDGVSVTCMLSAVDVCGVSL